MQVTNKIRLYFNAIITVLSITFLYSCKQNSEGKTTKEVYQTKPNIVLIMCDDMGFSDLGCYGGEIETPNIDALAKNGFIFSQFKNTGRCCPSRAALLTGRDQHEVNMGWMTAVDEHREGYRGEISGSVPTIAEVLKQNGYATYLSGKWHLSLNESFMNDNPKPNGSWPFERGFDKTYGGLSGGGGYYKVKALYSNEKLIDSFPSDYYYTNSITENAIDYIENHDTDTPYFLYLAHYAPHRPLEAPKHRVEKCMERYAVGYDILRKERFNLLKNKGLLASEVIFPIHEIEFDNKRPTWDDLSKSKQDDWILEMATYAAMVEIMDDGIGAVVKAIKDRGMYNNTIFLFLSDNGATREGGEISKLAADLSNTPYRGYKQYTYMGGTSSPLIISHPSKFQNEENIIINDIAHITDILPTCLDMVDVQYLKEFKGEILSEIDGVSLKPTLKGTHLKARNLYFEHQSSCAIISNNWKLVRESKNTPWELINLKTDPFELHDVSKNFPNKVLELESEWNTWAKNNNVLPLENKPWNTRINYYNSLPK
ncbi:MAG: arylsulfatase [Jejuia sp.]